MTFHGLADFPPILDRHVFHAGKTIFKEGAEGDCAYILQSGVVEIVRDTKDGKVTLGCLSAGSIFGEMALIDNAPRMASAIVVEACAVIIIRREMLQQKIAKADPFIARLLCLLVENVRNVTNDRVHGRPLSHWFGEEHLDLEYEPEEVSAALVKAPFIRRPQDR